MKKKYSAATPDTVYHWRQESFHLRPSYSNCCPEIRNINSIIHPKSFLELQTLRPQPRSTASKSAYHQDLQVSSMYNILSHSYCCSTSRRQSTQDSPVHINDLRKFQLIVNFLWLTKGLIKLKS